MAAGGGTAMTWRPTRRRVLQGIAGLGAVVAFPSIRVGASSPTPIRKLVFLMQENRSFDHYFGRMKGVDGLPPAAPVSRASGLCLPSPPHDARSLEVAFHAGLMDRFQTPAAKTFYTEEQVPTYWALARRFTLCDAYFASVLGPTFPNRLCSLAASPGGFIDDPTTLDVRLLPRPTLVDRLDEAGRDWACYLVHPRAQTYNPIAYYPERARDPRIGRTLGEFLHAARAGSLPDVSWIISDYPLNEHPPASIAWGQRLIALVVEALSRGQDWPQLALILNHDEAGGFYDHVVPPQVGGSRLGFRVPCLIVSPFSRPGYVSHLTYDHSSVVALAESVFRLRSLAAGDRGANPLTEGLDFDHAELALPHLPGPPADTSCGRVPPWAARVLAGEAV